MVGRPGGGSDDRRAPSLILVGEGCWGLGKGGRGGAVDRGETWVRPTPVAQCDRCHPSDEILIMVHNLTEGY